jgi:ethanolaminephosphotransferase
MAPNIISVSGFLLNVAYFSVIFYFWKVEDDEVFPSWVCFFSAFCYLIYQILDNIDGKQARRTNSSSPLGLLVDHGTDACTTFFITCGLGAILGLETIYQYILLWIMIIVPFYLNTWEEYITGEMSLPCINGINEGTFIIFFLECLVGFIAQDFLFQNQFNILGKTYQLNILISLTSFCAGIFFGLLSIYKILKMENVTNKLEALIDIFPFIYFLLGFFSIIYLTDSIFVSD